MPEVTLAAKTNGGAPQTGGVTAAGGNVIQLTVADKIGWTSANPPLWTIFEHAFEQESERPSDWTREEATPPEIDTYTWLGTADPPPFTIPTHGGMFVCTIDVVIGGRQYRDVVAIRAPYENGAYPVSGSSDANDLFGGAKRGAAAAINVNAATGTGDGGLTPEQEEQLTSLVGAAAAPTELADADWSSASLTITPATAPNRKIVADISQARTLVLDPTDAVDGVTRWTLDVNAFLSYSLTIEDDASNVLATIPAGALGSVECVADSGHFVLGSVWLGSKSQVANAIMMRDSSGNCDVAQLGVRDILIPANESTPTISQSQQTSGAGKDLAISPQKGQTSGTHKTGDLLLEGGPVAASDSGGFALAISGITTIRRRYDQTIPEVTDNVLSPLFTLRGTSLFQVCTSIRFISNTVEIDGQITSASLALGTSGAVAWNANSGHNAHCLASGNVTALTMTNTADGGRYELEFVPGVSHFTLTLSGITFPTTTYSQSDLTTLCGTATRIVLRIRNKRGTLYVLDYTGYSS